MIKELPEPKTEVPEENEVDKENEEYQNEKEAPVEQTANIIMIETPGQGEEQFYEDSTYSQEPTESQIAALSEIIPEENQDKGNVFESNQKDAGKIKDEHSKIENTDEKPLLQQILKLLQQSRGESDQDFKIASSTKNCKKSINFSVQQTQDNEETHQVPQVTEKEFEALATNISVPNELKLKYCMPNEATQVCHTINSANASIYTVNTPENSYVYIPNSSGSQEMDVNQSYDSVNSTTVTSPLTSTPATGNFLIEISGPDDMVNVPPHASVRISPELVQRTYATSHAFGPFGWSLVKEVYTKSERLGKSFNGNSTSKPPFSPRRKKALQLAIECMADRFELKDALIKNANECIVNGLRNEGRSRLVLSELTPKIHNKANMWKT